MVTAVRIFGIVIMGMGILFLLNPNALKQLMVFGSQGRRLYVVGVFRLLIGSILLFAAPQFRLPEVIIVLGILFLAGGIYIFAFPLEKTKLMFDRLSKKPLLVLRLIGFVPLVVIGGLLIYFAQ